MQKRERIYIFLHWPGIVFGLVAISIFALGFMVDASGGLARMLAIALGVAGIVVLIQSNDNLRGVTITGCHSAPAAAGEDAILSLVLHNASDQERIGLRVRSRDRALRAAPAWVPVLPPHGTATVSLRLPTTRRGRFAIPSIWVSSVHPVGFCFAWKIFPQDTRIVVYPRPRGIPFDDRPGAADGAGVGRNTGGDDVGGHRPYEAGDMLTRLDWRVFARTGKLLVRTLEGAGGERIALRWDDTYFLPDPEARLEQLSFWICRCRQEGRAFTLDLGDTRQDLNSGNPARCLEALADFPQPS